MNTITVSKNRLIETLRLNRDEHKAIFDKAQAIYREKMIEELDRMLAEAKAGQPIRRGFTLPVPEDHTEEFDTAIQMLEWETGEEVELVQNEFMNYVENNWGWARSFAANTGSYLAQ
jgi:hypothetical protein